MNHSDREFDFLCVDDFIGNMIDARALATAFEVGMIDVLARDGESATESLQEKLDVDERGLFFLLNLLLASGVIHEEGGVFSLTGRFVRALRFRDLMEMKLSLCNFAAHDFLEFFSDFVAAPEKFMSKARFPRLFAYDRCYGSGEEDRRVTERWMRITTVLTKYEAQACLKYHDFGRYRRMLDIGGNSGEFALQLCRKNSRLLVDVFDLPLVCDVGRDYLAGKPEADRISFIPGNAMADELPSGYDLVTFKSMLHDWPDHPARELMKKATRALKSDGTIVIFERAAYDLSAGPLPHSVFPLLIFFHSYRLPEFYTRSLEELGFSDIECRIVNLEMPFLLVKAVRRGEG